ncbi:MAG: cytochrome d ubiquinol oxidase subunit II [Polyangiales bacterium]
MATLWFFLLAFMLTTYVILDGFDLGAGVLHLFVAKRDEERRTVLASIGPVWDGNEVWLLASGGLLVFAFPRVYASAFSGFYMALMMLLWVVIVRGVAIELRSQIDNPLWRAFWDTSFAFSSFVIALVLGVALGNVMRGVPVDATGYFSAPLFTNFGLGPHPGALDWYTVLIGLFAVAALVAHASAYLLWKTEGPVRARVGAIAVKAWIAVCVLLVAITAASLYAAPGFFHRLASRPWAWVFVVAAIASAASAILAVRKGRDRMAFLSSCAFLATGLLVAASGLYPVLLRSTLGPAFDLDVTNSASGHDSLVLGLTWWVPALVLAIIYFWILFRSMRGRVALGNYEH